VVERLAVNQNVACSIHASEARLDVTCRFVLLNHSRGYKARTGRKPHSFCRGIAQSGSASALGAEGRGFESLFSDHLF
jgi:hypothetical protein